MYNTGNIENANGIVMRREWNVLKPEVRSENVKL